MPLIGPWCAQCGKRRPVVGERLCSQCRSVPPFDPQPDQILPPLTESSLLDHQSFEFSRELNAWRARGPHPG